MVKTFRIPFIPFHPIDLELFDCNLQDLWAAFFPLHLFYNTYLLKNGNTGFSCFIVLPPIFPEWHIHLVLNLCDFMPLNAFHLLICHLCFAMYCNALQNQLGWEWINKWMNEELLRQCSALPLGGAHIHTWYDEENFPSSPIHHHGCHGREDHLYYRYNHRGNIAALKKKNTVYPSVYQTPNNSTVKDTAIHTQTHST